MIIICRIKSIVRHLTYNEAFIIDTAARDALISAELKSDEIIRRILRGRGIKRCTHANLLIYGLFVLI